MIRNFILMLTFVFTIIVCKAQVKHKMFVGLHNSGQYKLNIIPLAYDSAVTDQHILQCVDSLPGGAFHAKTYHVLYANDTTRLAMQVTEGTYMFHTRYAITEFWKNGNIKRVTYFTKHLEPYWSFSYYSDASPQSTGRYDGNTKKGKWRYFNADGNLVKVEKYATGGILKSTCNYDPARRTATTIFNPKHPKGLPYVIQ